MQRDRVIIVLSYLALPTVSALIEQRIGQCIVVTPLRPLAKFLRRLYPDVTVQQFDRNPHVKNSPLGILLKVHRVRQQMSQVWSQLRQTSDAEVYLLNSTFCEFEAWLFKKLGTRNRLYFEAAEHMPHLPVDWSPKALTGRLWRRLVYGIDFVPLAGVGLTYYSIGDKFRSATGALRFQVPDRPDLSSRIAAAYPEVENGAVLLLCGMTAGKLVEEGHYATHVSEVIALAHAIFGEHRVRAKSHPRFPDYVSAEANLPAIPPEVPANLIFGRFAVVIGYSSAALAEAANEGTVAVSLLRLMSPISEEVRDSHVTYLENLSSGLIHYPESLQQLEQLLKSGLG